MYSSSLQFDGVITAEKNFETEFAITTQTKCDAIRLLCNGVDEAKWHASPS